MSLSTEEIDIYETWMKQSSAKGRLNLQFEYNHYLKLMIICHSVVCDHRKPQTNLYMVTINFNTIVTHLAFPNLYTVLSLLEAPGAKTLPRALLFRAICVS